MAQEIKEHLIAQTSTLQQNKAAALHHSNIQRRHATAQ
jgi:hypothetical protein